MNTTKQKLFAEVKPPVITPSEYDKIEVLKKPCEMLSHMCNKSIYIIDYLKQEFFYVSPHPLFLCGYTAKEVLKMGYDFYEKVFSPEDLEMELEINRFGWQLFYETAPDERNDFVISNDLYLEHKNGVKTLVNHRLSPFYLTKEGDVWLAICTVGYSPAKNPGNIFLTKKDKTEYFTYDLNQKRIHRYRPTKLTRREEEIILLSMRGYEVETIAEKLKISPHTVKNHRAHIGDKLNVNNLSSAAVTFYSTFFNSNIL